MAEKRSVGVARSLIIGGVIAALMLGLLEGLSRGVVGQAARGEIDPVKQAGHVNGGMKFDPELGWTWPELPSPLVNINSHGFRNPEMPVVKPPGTWRAIALGDSQTFGAGVHADKTWPRFTERALKETLGEGAQVEVLNAGISGYTSLQGLRLMRLRHGAFSPDLYLVDLKTFDSRRDAPELPLYGLPRALGPLLFKSSLYYAITLITQTLKEAGRGDRPYRPADPSQPPRELAWYNHDLVLAEAARQGAGVLFLDFPFWDGPERGDQVRCLVAPEDLPREALRAPACAAIQDAGVPFAALFFDNNHLTERGNQIVGEAVAAAVMASPYAPSPSSSTQGP